MSEANAATESAQCSLSNAWVLRAGRNPYLHNVFALLGIDPDGSQKSYNSAVNRFRQKVSTSGEVRLGYQVRPEDAARAEHLERQEHEFAIERMLAHTAHTLQIDAFKEAMQAIETAPFPQAKDLLPLAVQNLKFLSERLPDLDANLIENSSEFPDDLLPELLTPDRREETFFDT